MLSIRNVLVLLHGSSVEVGIVSRFVSLEDPSEGLLVFRGTSFTSLTVVKTLFEVLDDMVRNSNISCDSNPVATMVIETASPRDSSLP